MTTYRKSIDPLVAAMTQKLLDKEDEKTNWKYSSIADLLSLMDGEVHELRMAFDVCNPEQVMAEAVDVANFAMMVFDNASDIVTKIKGDKDGDS